MPCCPFGFPAQRTLELTVGGCGSWFRTLHQRTLLAVEESCQTAISI